MKALAYIRVSTDEQAKSGLGLAAQREAIEAYIKMRGMDLAGTYEDAGVSGYGELQRRPAGRAMLEALHLLTLTRSRKRDTIAVVASKLDRAFRSATDCLATVERWQKKHICLHIVDLGGNAIDVSSAAGRFMLVVMAGAAELERNLGSERTTAALAIKRANGERIGGQIPYGYMADPVDPGRVIVNADETIILDKIMDLAAEGHSLRKIAHILDDEGYFTRDSRNWCHTTIDKIIRRMTAPA